MPAQEAAALAAGCLSLTEQLRQMVRQGKSFAAAVSDAPDEKCGLLFLMEALSPWAADGQISLLVLPRWLKTEGGVSVYSCWREVPSWIAAEMHIRPVPVPARIIRDMAGQWQQLQKENAMLRAVINGRVRSVREDFYDEVLARCLKEADGEGLQSFLGRVQAAAPAVSPAFARRWFMAEGKRK